MPLDRNNIFFGMGPTLTDEQREYIDSMIDNRLTIVNSCSGTGKTTLAVGTCALLQMKLLYLFAPVQEQQMGFRPGTQEEKENEYTAPLRCALEKLNYIPDQCMHNISRASDPSYERLFAKQEKDGNIWVYPMSHIFARGTNIENRFVVIDEAQNWTVEELRKILTRIHDNCKVVMIGHTGQCDLNDPKSSGFVDYIELFKDKSYAKICNLTKNFRGELSRDADSIYNFTLNNTREKLIRRMQS